MKRGKRKDSAELLTMEQDPHEVEQVAAERALVKEIVRKDPETYEGIAIDGMHKVYGEAKPPVHAVRGMS